MVKAVDRGGDKGDSEKGINQAETEAETRKRIGEQGTGGEVAVKPRAVTGPGAPHHRSARRPKGGGF